MSPPEPAPAQPPRKRGWFRRSLRWLGWIVLVVAIFHRPLFHFTVRTALRFAAARAHVDLDLRTSGTIFTNLTVSGVKARADGSGVTPIRLINIESVRLDYSIPSLLKHGLGELLQSYEIHHATLELEALPSKSKAERKEKVRIAKLLNDILGQPAAYSDRVHIDDFNITVRAPGNVTEVKGVHLLLDPENFGHLRVARLAVPGLPVWENLAAETSYVERNFFIKGLPLAPELMIDELNFDASQRAQNKGSVMLKAQVFGGTALLTLAGEELAKGGDKMPNAYATELKVELADVAIDRAMAYFKAPKPPVAKLSRLSVAFTGEPELPRTWRGNLAARVEGIAAGPVKLDAAEVRATFDQGTAELTAVNVAAGKNDVSLTARIGLPEAIEGFSRSDVEGTLKVAAPDLPALTGMMPEPLTGAIHGGGKIALRGGKLDLDLALDAQKIANKNLGVGIGKLALRVSKQLDPPTASPFDTLAAKVTADFSELRVQTFTADTLRLDAETLKRLVKVHALELRRGENAVTAEGSATLPADPAQIAKMPVDAKFALHVPQLGAFGIVVNQETLAGQLEGAGTLKLVDGALAGGVKIDGSAFALGGFKVERLAAKIDVANNAAEIDQLALQFNDTDQLAITGKAGIAKPFAYEGALLVAIKNLAVLQPLLEVFGQKQPLGGALQIDWNGQGEIAPQKHTGEFSVALSKGKFGNIDLSEIQLGGLYTPEFLETKPFRFVTGQTSLGGVIEYRSRKLRLRELNLAQAGTQVLSGYAFVPFDPANPKKLVPMEERVAANINTTKLDLEKLLASFGQKSPVAGAITANLVVGGTLLEPSGHLKVNGERLQAEAAKQFDAAQLVLDVHYSDKELTVASTLKQPQIQPLTLKARAPLDLEATIKAGKVDPNLPLDATAQLPASSLAFVPKVAPQVRRIEGTAALDVRVGGTVAKPAFSGGANVALTGARLVDENVPAIGAFRAKLAFAENVLKFDQFEGEIGGGTFKLGGTIGLTDPKDPVFALRLESKEVLVKRDDSITVRADTDVKVDGPLKAGVVSGTVFIVRSRFFKEIDILPIAMPGKAKPAPKSAAQGPTTVSIPQPPIRDWKFDLAIRTRDDDPFLIRGNLANGAAAVSLKLGGTGLAPYLEGTVSIKQFVASLPFSTLSISSGFVAFNKDAPFQPTLELQAESQVRDYLVRAYIYGKANDPQVQLSSEPPLPHADIVSLLATGTTTSELAGSADALASRAAMLAVQQLYRKIFKRGAAPPPDTKQASAGSIRDRFDLELGALDNRGGGQEVTARYKVNDQTYVLGEIGVDGSFTGSLKYLIRFR